MTEEQVSNHFAVSTHSGLLLPLHFQESQPQLLEAGHRPKPSASPLFLQETSSPLGVLIIMCSFSIKDKVQQDNQPDAKNPALDGRLGLSTQLLLEGFFLDPVRAHPPACPRKRALSGRGSDLQ